LPARKARSGQPIRDGPEDGPFLPLWRLSYRTPHSTRASARSDEKKTLFIGRGVYGTKSDKNAGRAEQAGKMAWSIEPSAHGYPHATNLIRIWPLKKAEQPDRAEFELEIGAKKAQHMCQ